MEIYPAIDLLGGACVRLHRGEYDRVTRFSDDPVGVARRFVSEGARRLHVVDLDGARDGRPVNASVVRDLLPLGVPLQVGGGIRADGDVEAYLGAGVRRVILGTTAAERPDRLAGLVGRHGAGRVAASVDVRDGAIRVRGWVERAGLSPDELLDRLAAAGVRTVVYTDIARDGTLEGVRSSALRALAGRGFRVIVAGGVASLDDVGALRDAGARGAVIGSALYCGTLRLADALEVAEGC